MALQILGVALIFSLYSWFYTSCVLIPAKKEKDVLIATVIAGITNLVLNIALVPSFIQNAAAFTTLLAEFLSFLICYLKARKIVTIKPNKRNIFSTLLGCLGIFVFCLIINMLLNLNVILSTIICIIGSACIYLAITSLMKNEILNDFKHSLKNKLIKYKEAKV